MRYLPILALSLLGCTATQRSTQIQVADAISTGMNTLVPTIVEQYKIDLRMCRVEDPENTHAYLVCASEVEQRWGAFKSLWRQARHYQDEYATAIETHNPSLPDYAGWLQTAYCEMKAASPAGLQLPDVPGLVCEK